jgi:hypothetical protein
MEDQETVSLIDIVSTEENRQQPEFAQRELDEIQTAKNKKRASRKQKEKKPDSMSS